MARKTKEQAKETRQQIIDAARSVFHQWGVSRASLDMVAKAAGLTRGAIYWHFKDKAELFLAVRKNVLLPIAVEIDAIVGSERYADPLDGIEAALRRFFQILDDWPGVRMVLETIACRCEQVAEFADVQSEIDRPTAEFLAKLEYAYREAAAMGTLRPGLDPRLIARDTWAFAYGLMYRLLSCEADGEFSRRVGEMISFHMALRRLSQTRSSGVVEALA